VKFLVILLAAISLANAGGVLVGARGAINFQNGSYERQTNDKRAYGAGGVLGYEGESWRVFGAYEDFGIEKDSTYASLSAQVVNRADRKINTYLGLEGGRAKIRYKTQPESESATLAGAAIGVILLDDRYQNMQMELGYRYLKAFGSFDEGFKFDRVHQISLAFCLNFGI
jgi:hypothetical protein